jgi:hypothetical protein
MAGHMAPFRTKSSGGGSGLRRAGDDAFKLTVDYLKQEALDPLKGLGRFLLWGVVGSLAIAVGVLLVLVGILRLLQSETGTALTGNWSWVPYFAVALIGLGVVGAAAWRITAGPGKRKLPKEPKHAAGRSSSDVPAGVGATGVRSTGVGATGLGSAGVGATGLGSAGLASTGLGTSTLGPAASSALGIDGIDGKKEGSS